MNIKNYIASIFACTAFAAPVAHAADASVESVVGTKRVDLDLLVKGYPTEHVRLVARDLPRVAYDGATTNFLLGRAELGNWYGFRPAVEGQKGDSFAVVRGGLVYGNSFGKVDLFLETVTSHNLQWEQTAIVSYTRGPFEITLEGVATFGRQTPIAFAALPRLRYHVGEHYAVGVGVNTNHTEQSHTYAHHINLGISGQINF